MEDPVLKRAENALVMMAMHEKEVYNLKLSHSVVIDDVWAANPTLGELYFMFGWQGHMFFCVQYEDIRVMFGNSTKQARKGWRRVLEPFLGLT